jgi:hypothetical protein
MRTLWKTHILSLLPIAAVIGCSLIPRIDESTRTLCVAESWVANSILAGSLHDMFYYPPWLQTTPPLFLFLERVTVKAIGTSNITLRALPIACGFVAVILLAVLAMRMLQPLFALVCTILLGFSPWAVIFAKELKEYSVGVFTTCLILLLVWEYIQHPDRRRYLALLVAFAVTLPLSYSAIFFVPLALLVIVLYPDSTAGVAGKRTTATRSVALAAISAVIAGLNYFVFVKPNSSTELKSFWANGFLYSYHGIGKVEYFVKHFAAMPVAFFFPPVSPFRHNLWSVKGLPIYLQFFALAAILLVAGMTVFAVFRTRSHRWAVLFFLIPLLTLAGFNLAGFYPVSSRRLTLFIAPCVALSLAAVLEALWQSFLAPVLSKRSQQMVQLAASIACLIGVAALTAHAAAWDLDPNDDGGVESAVSYLKSDMRTHQDMLYVHSWAEEPARLYVRLFRWDDTAIRYGHTGLPCCKRVSEIRPLDPAQERAYVLDDFRQVTGGGPPGDLWLLFRGFPLGDTIDHDKKIITESLSAGGCREDLERNFGSVVVDRFHCVNPSLFATHVPPGQMSSAGTTLSRAGGPK